MPGAPHIAYPFQFTAGHVRITQQGSIDEITDCVRTLLLYRLGSRPLIPEFGVEDQAFEQGNPDLEEIRAAIAANEPRADVDLDLSDETLTEIAHGVARVRVSTSALEAE